MMTTITARGLASRAIRQAAVAFGALLVFASVAAAQGYTASTVTAAPPAELSAAVRASLSDQAIEVKGPQGEFCELWLRQEIPAAATAPMALGVVYSQLTPGTLVGAIQFPAQVVDFRNQKIKPGVYTLRYELSPVNGNHQGVAPQRDFLLLSPPAADTTADTLDFKALVKLSRETVSSGHHPSVWSLTAADGAPAQLPAVAAQDSDNGTIQVLFFNANMGPAGAAKPTPVALVIVGVSSAS